MQGRKLNLISRDDGYDPDRSMVQTIKLIEQDQVFALIGAVGTPTSKATVPIAAANNVPFIGPFSGADFLRSSEFHNVVNIRASYSDEAEAWIKHLTEDLHLSQIAIFYQDLASAGTGWLASRPHSTAAGSNWSPKAPLSVTRALSVRR